MSFIINKGSNNTVALTLKEKATLTDPYYLFKMTCVQTNASKYFIADDTSTYTDRSNVFTITESSSEILTSGTVSLSPQGLWFYEIYEQTSSSNLDPAQATNTTPIEKGMARVIGDEIEFNTYSEGETEFKAYSPDL